VVGDYLAGAAELEAASVTAFEFLAGELEAHGAPARLIAAARKSGQEERRHTRSMSALAKRFGGEFNAPRVRPRRPRSLRAMAVENAVEGCVREAFGALVATHQAAHAGDPRVRRAMRRIAADETSHAALAFRVAAWLHGRLDAAAARSVRTSIRNAGKTLLREAAAPVHPALTQELGLPRPEAALKMARGLLAALDPSAA
jgi:rubrerythrin